MTLRIGFAGAGLMGWAHSLVVRSMIEAGLVDARIVTCYDSDLARAENFARIHEAIVAPDIAALVGDLDVVWVCTPTAAHRPVLEVAVAAGTAVFCEKPLAPNLAEAESLTALIAASGVPAQVGLVLRSAPVFRALGKAVASGELGRLMAVVFRDDQFFPIQGHYASSWRADVSMAGGGTLIEHSIHDVDILRAIFGPVATAAGITDNFAGYEGVEDVATGTLVFQSGGVASLVSAWHQVTTRPSTRRVEVIHEHGVAWLEDDVTGPLTVQTAAGTEVRETPFDPWVIDLPLFGGDIGLALRSYAAADRSFLDAVAEGSPPQPTFEDALAAHRIVDALYRSAADAGRPVNGPF